MHIEEFQIIPYLQWMTAGRGIVHCEMPASEDEGHGLQLWVNLKQKFKMTEPAYQELLDKDIPRTTKAGVTVKVIAGESLGIKVNLNIQELFSVTAMKKEFTY